MSNQNAAPLSNANLFLEPTAGPLAGEPATGILTHRPRPEPAGYMCTCGKVREACVHEEIRAIWGTTAATTKDLGQ